MMMVMKFITFLHIPIPMPIKIANGNNYFKSRVASFRFNVSVIQHNKVIYCYFIELESLSATLYITRRVSQDSCL